MKGVMQSQAGPVLKLDSRRVIPLRMAANYIPKAQETSDKCIMGRILALRGWGFDVPEPPANEGSIEWTT